MAGGRVEILPEEWGGQSLVTALRNGKDRSLVKITPAHLELLNQQIDPKESGRQHEGLRHWRREPVGGEPALLEKVCSGDTFDQRIRAHGNRGGLLHV